MLRTSFHPQMRNNAMIDFLSKSSLSSSVSLNKNSLAMSYDAIIILIQIWLPYKRFSAFSFRLKPFKDSCKPEEALTHEEEAFSAASFGWAQIFREQDRSASLQIQFRHLSFLILFRVLHLILQLLSGTMKHKRKELGRFAWSE